MAHTKGKIPTNAPLNEEEKIMQIKRAMAQKRMSLVEGFLFNLTKNPSIVASVFAEPEKVVEASVKLADCVMNEFYGKPLE